MIGLGPASVDGVSVTGSVAVTNLPTTQPVSGSVSVSNFPATQPVSGSLSISNLPATQAISAVSLPLPSGASTASNQSTANSSLASIDGKSPTIGQKTSSGSSPVVLASDQSAVPVTQQDSSFATYSAAISGVVIGLTATDVFTISGSATKKVYIHRIFIDGTATGGVNSKLLVIKRSSLDTGGTSSTATAVPHDSTDGAATAVVKSYTANPTLGTAVGNLICSEVAFPTAGTQLYTDGDLLTGYGPKKPYILNSASESICLNLNGVTISGSSLNFVVTWTEK